MRRLVAPLGAAMIGGLAVGAAYAVAQELQERAEREKGRIAEEAAAHAAQRGSRGELPEDNSLCLLCHANFKDEELVTKHLAHGITCAVCHGISYEHMDDETSRTKPDILFGRAEVASFCDRCHAGHQTPDKVAAFLAEWKGKTRPNGRLILQQAMCTDCHGTHVIPAVPVVTGERHSRN